MRSLRCKLFGHKWLITHQRVWSPPHTEDENPPYVEIYRNLKCTRCKTSPITRIETIPNWE